LIQGHRSVLPFAARPLAFRRYDFLALYTVYPISRFQSSLSAYYLRAINIPMSTFYPRNGRKSDWLTPKQKRAELLKLDYGTTA
jgi:hypothetical protein